jgi:hypothetical protein
MFSVTRDIKKSKDLRPRPDVCLREQVRWWHLSGWAAVKDTATETCLFSVSMLVCFPDKSREPCLAFS